MVAPVLQVLPVALEEVNVTLPPAQNVVGPLLVITGAAGKGLTVTVVETHVDAGLQADPAFLT